MSRICDTLGSVADSSKLDPPIARAGAKRTNRDTTIHIRVTDQALQSIDQQAKKEQRTRSDMIRVLLRRGMEHS